MKRTYEELTHDVVMRDHWLEELRAENEKLAAALVAKDAARYRWIRKCIPFSTLKNVSKRYAENVPNKEVDAQLDTAIDAMIHATQEESYCNAAADALEEAERKSAIAREALRLAGDEPNLDKARKIADAALAQIGEKQ